jgi:hemerythrin-like domain-containing protein
MCPAVRLQNSASHRRDLMQAIAILHAEHRSLAAVMHGLLYLVRDVRLRGAAPRFDVLATMIDYINAFPERFHHPKEEAYLFRLLAKRWSDAAPLIEELQAEHRLSAAKIRALEHALERYRQGGAGEFKAFAEAAADYATLQWHHIRTEEDKLVPLARAYLTASDWKLIDEAFSGHSDPLSGVKAEDEYENLFRRIVELAPPPLGCGPK